VQAPQVHRRANFAIAPASDDRITRPAICATWYQPTDEDLNAKPPSM
jgi:hypothetical protein